MFKPAVTFAVIGSLMLASVPQALAQGKSDERGNSNASENSGGGNGNGNSGNNGNNGNPGNGNGPPGAGANGHGDEKAALEAKRQGRAVPLEDILAGLGSEAAGNVIDAELITVEGFLLYALKVLSPGGVVSTQYFYAQSGRPVD